MATATCLIPKETPRPIPAGHAQPCSRWQEQIAQQHSQQPLQPPSLQSQQMRAQQLSRNGRDTLRRRPKERISASERPGSGASGKHDAAASVRAWSCVSGGKRSSQPLNPLPPLHSQKQGSISMLQQRRACKPKPTSAADSAGCQSLGEITERGRCRCGAARRSRPVPPIRDAAAGDQSSAGPLVTLEIAASVVATVPTRDVFVPVPPPSMTASEALCGAPSTQCKADASCEVSGPTAAESQSRSGEGADEGISPGSRPPKVVIPVETDDMALATPPTGSSSMSSVKNSPQEPLGSDFSPPVLRRNSTLPTQGTSAQASPLESASLRYEPIPPGRDRVRLCYDSLLDCYFDPVTGRYFELLS